MELVDLDTALAEGDVISVHMNLTADNKYFFTKETFAKMKKHPIFINEGRGEMVEEAALKWALDCLLYTSCRPSRLHFFVLLYRTLF